MHHDPDSPEQTRGCSSLSGPETKPPACGCSRPHYLDFEALPRRQFLKIAGGSVLATSLARPFVAMAGPFNAGDTSHGRLIPADKQLDAAWVQALFERGTKEVFRGKALESIGMPCGGIATGQIYLCGDGTLGCWQIFNNAESNWVENTHSTYQHRGIAKPVDQGFAVAVGTSEGRQLLKKLDRQGFDDIEFQGEYPIATVRYGETSFPVRVTLEAFSPFIPLNAKDSALPATVFHLAVENASEAPIQASILGWLDNAVCLDFGREHDGLRRTCILEESGRRLALHSAEKRPVMEDAWAKEALREPILFEDFEGDDYGDWEVSGEAFGTGPAHGTLPDQHPVSGFEGKGLVNTFLGGDSPRGTLISPPFTINRRFINVLVGGGKYAKKTCVNLEVNGEVVRTSAGENVETLSWHGWNVKKWEGKEARIVIVDAESGGWGHVNVDSIEFSDEQREGVPVVMDQAPDFGTMALACLEPASGMPEEPLYPLDAPGLFVESGSVSFDIKELRRGLLRSKRVTLAPGEKTVYRFVLTWHFPNQPNGHEYAARFADAAEVVRYVHTHHERLTKDTRLWRDTYYDSTLPYWLLDRLHAPMANLATGTAQWWENGRFWAYEGVTCCQGTCTHVWNYAHGHARLFPELARSIREMQDFNDRANGGGFHPDTGLVGFRSDDNYAADGQCGTILKAYREHLTSADDSFLKRNWPRIKKALEYSISRDGNDDGLIEDTQHNTYDINYEGANTFVGSLYLAALRAGEEMAKEMGDGAFATRTRALYESGRKLTAERLWNGEYYIQDVNLEKHPNHQYKDGCLSDHLFGQGWAHQVALGYIYPKEHVSTALKSIWQYNWAPDIAPYNEARKPFRWFISPGQAGLFTCTWPKGEYLPKGTLYKNEVWTGIEYQAAGHMIWEGLLEEGLAICRAVHDRYHPLLFNPYNEVECGDHYARALASWGVYLALAGFRYHGPKGHIGFAPRMTPEAFRAAFTTAQGWGAFTQERDGNRQHERIEMRWGTLRLSSLAFEPPEGKEVREVTATVNGKPLSFAYRTENSETLIDLETGIELQTGDLLDVEILLAG